MYVKQPKKLMIVNILSILHCYTDKKHRLSQKEIGKILKSEYDMEADRKAIKRNLLDLIGAGYAIDYSTTGRSAANTKREEESSVLTGFYLRHEFDDTELRFLIDSLLCAEYIPGHQRKELIKKLMGLSNRYFPRRVGHIAVLSEPEDKTKNQEFFLNIELLDEAIRHNRKVAFQYVQYGTDKKLHPKRQTDGTEREYVVSPYQMVAKEGKYYLICNYEPNDDISHYRVDHIRELNILDEPSKPFGTLLGANGQRLKLAEYVKEHPYMCSGKTIRVKFRITKPMIGEVVERFARDIKFSDEDEAGVTVTAWIDESSAERFAKTYLPDVVVLEPRKLAERVRNSVREILLQYQENAEDRKDG